MSSVLIVDDELAYRRVLAHIVVDLGHEAVFGMIDDPLDPDVHLVIVSAPHDGAEGIRRLCRLYEQVPVIVTTNQGGDDEQQMMLDAGAADCVHKPFRPTRIGRIVEAELGVPA